MTPSADELEKLKTLEAILKYHQRDSVVELKVLRVTTATAVFLAGAAVLITKPALKILTNEELQAVVAHELGHEYYWNRFELARQSREYRELQELELRCDGVAVVTLSLASGTGFIRIFDAAGEFVFPFLNPLDTEGIAAL